MYDSSMISDLQNRFPQTKAVQLMKDEDFITTLAFNLPYFRAIDKKLRLTAAVYAAQYIRDQADMFGTAVTIIPFTKRVNWWLVGGISAVAFATWKVFSTTRDSVVNVMPQVAAAAVGATPIGAAGTIANKAAALVPEVDANQSSVKASGVTNSLSEILMSAMKGESDENE